MTSSNKLVVHIGLGKTATTTLQKHIFPTIAEMKGYAYNSNRLHELLYRQHLTTELTEERAVLDQNLPPQQPTFLSNEALVGWQPSDWESHADKNLEILGPDATIIISVREPQAFMTSLFLEMFKQGVIKSPHEFLMDRTRFDQTAGDRCRGVLMDFSVDDFDLEHLHSLYASRFRSVYIMPLESLPKAWVLTKAFNLSDAESEQIKSRLKNAKRENIAHSARGVRLILWRERVLNLFGKSAFDNNARHRFMAACLKPLTDLSGYHATRFWDLPLRDRIRVFPSRLKRKLLHAVKFRSFVETFADRLLPYEKYVLPTDVYRNAALTEKNRQFIARVLEQENTCAQSKHGA